MIIFCSLAVFLMAVSAAWATWQLAKTNPYAIQHEYIKYLYREKAKLMEGNMLIVISVNGEIYINPESIRVSRFKLDEDGERKYLAIYNGTFLDGRIVSNRIPEEKYTMMMELIRSYIKAGVHVIDMKDIEKELEG